MLHSRRAPTPSGYLHLGNAVNFIITWVLVRKGGGVLRLRIDDADGSRCRPEYVADIFRQLEWLGIDWDEGPGGPDEFARLYSQQYRFERYRQVLQELQEVGSAYVCTCSRTEIKARAGSAVYPGFCRQKNIVDDGQAAIRLHVPSSTVITVGDREVPLATMMGDFILWRRDNSPAYQLASLVDDLDHDINLIVRGEDLLASSAAQLFLARSLGDNIFSQVQFFHHGLLSCPLGNKLSKSDQALSLNALHEQGGKVAIYQAAAPYLGLDPCRVTTLTDLLHGTFS